jgi:hypothetical protein
MAHDPSPDKAATTSQAERALLVEICRYFAQVLYACRNSFDSLDPEYRIIKLPPCGCVPAQTVLLDGAVEILRCAASTLVECGFATQAGPLSERYTLGVSSDEFAFDATSDAHLAFYRASWDILDIFRIYEQSAWLGHPATLKRIFGLFQQAGITEERFGHIEWSQQAVDLARERTRRTRTDKQLLWPTDTFEWYVDEAEKQWSQPPRP